MPCLKEKGLSQDSTSTPLDASQVVQQPPRAEKSVQPKWEENGDRTQEGGPMGKVDSEKLTTPDLARGSTSSPQHLSRISNRNVVAGENSGGPLLHGQKSVSLPVQQGWHGRNSFGTSALSSVDSKGVVRMQKPETSVTMHVDAEDESVMRLIGICMYLRSVGKVTDSCLIADAGAVFNSCSIRISSVGLTAEPESIVPNVSQLPGHWAVPWDGISHICEAEVLAESSRPPPSHIHVVQVTASSCSGFLGCSGCIALIAFSTNDGMQSFLRAVTARMHHHILRQNGDAPAQGFRLDGEVGPQRTRANAQLSSLGVGAAAVKDAEPLHVVHVNNVPVPLTSTMASLFTSFQAEDSEQPTPVNLEKVWIYMPPTCNGFQRSTLCVDKLGLTIRPVVAADKLPETSRRGAVLTSEEAVLMTEALNFPISSVVDVVEETDFAPATASARPQPSTSTLDHKRNNAGSSRRCVMPFARALFAHSSTGDSSGGPPIPPHPHLVGVRVKGALAGRHHAERTPAHLRLHAQPPPPVVLVLSFPVKEEALLFISQMLAYKKYHLSVALSTYINSFTAVSTRESQRRGHHLMEENDCMHRMQQQVTAPSVEPPPLPPRPADLQPPNRLPRMVTNDEGEVFWYIPRKQKPPASCSPPPPQPNMVEPLVEPPTEMPSKQLQAKEVPATLLITRPSEANDQKATIQTDSVREPVPAERSVLDGFEEEMPLADTPAPCLLSPTPSPGRMQRTL